MNDAPDGDAGREHEVGDTNEGPIDRSNSTDEREDTEEGEETEVREDTEEGEETEVREDAEEGEETEVRGEPNEVNESQVNETERVGGDDLDERPDADQRSEGVSGEESVETPPMPDVPNPTIERQIPEDVQKYARFQKMDGAQYERVNEFLRDRTYITAREWAIARLCSDFRTETGIEMTKIGENLPELVPFMTDTYTPQAVNQARSSFKEKVRKSGATFLYGAMCDFFTAEELDDVMYEATEVAKFLLEVEGVDLSVDEELEAEDRISSVMREVREASKELREDEFK